MDSSSKLAAGLFAAFVASAFAFLIAPGITAALVVDPTAQATTGYAVLVAVWALPAIMIAIIVAYFAFKAIRRE
jgi:hypothetical protein